MKRKSVRTKMKEDLAWIGLKNPRNLHTFRQMYSHKDLEKPIDKIVDDMPVEQISWAVTQIKNTIDLYNESFQDSPCTNDSRKKL